MATAEELLATVGNEQNYIVIDSDLRTMTFPASVKNIGVENDKDVHKLNFMMPRYFSEYDLSTFNIRINYLNAQGDGDMYVVTDPTIEEDAIYFTWLVGRHACLYRGAVTFIVCLKLADGEGDVVQEYNTTLASLQVLPGLETEPTILETDYDIIEQLLLTIQDTNGKIKAVLDSGMTAEELGNIAKEQKTLKSRMNEFASLPDGSTTGDAELADIRVGADGTQYATAGEAVRTQIANVKEVLNGKVNLPKEIVDVPITVQTGYYTASGFTSGSGFKAAKEAVTEGENLLLTGSGNTYAHAYYFVDNNGTVISKADSALEMTDYEIVVPTGAVFVEINASGTNKNIGMKRTNYDEGFSIEDLTNQIGDLTNQVDESTIPPADENIELDVSWDSGYRVNGTTISQNASYYSTVIPVSAGEKYGVIIYFKESWFYGVYLYDSNMSSAGHYIVGNGTTTRYEQEIEIATDGFMVVNAYAWNNYKGIFKIVTVTAKDRIEKLESSKWAGKTIWWCGTSIPANGAPVGEENLSYPAYVGKLLGANVINKAISSSCARRGWKNKETESDLYGWTDVPWQNVFLAMGANLTEKQDLIDNYDTWKNVIGGDFPGSSGDGTGTGKPESLTQEWIDKINASSYENILIPYLDGTYDMPDLFVFDHGHNDYGNGETSSEMTSAPADPYDRSTFIGAMSFFFEKIFVANPHAKIVIISHYANDSGKQNTITTAQNNLADLWDLPIFDSYKKLGWSQRVITTTGYWDATTSKWVNTGGTEQNIAMINVYLMDGLHPSSDQSGNAIMQYGSEIAQYLNNNIVADKHEI